jgi:hypothetical protein
LIPDYYYSSFGIAKKKNLSALLQIKTPGPQAGDCKCKIAYVIVPVSQAENHGLCNLYYSIGGSGLSYLLRALRHPVRFSTVFDFKRECTPPWADEEAHIVARRDTVDVAVDVLGGAPENPGLSVAHYASDIEGITDWIEKQDTASVLLIPSELFGPDAMARYRSSSKRNVLLMGQLKSYTVGNNASLDAKTVAGALTSLHPDHWFKQAVCYLVSLLSSSH